MSDNEFGRRGNMVARRIVDKDRKPTGEVMWWFWCPGCEECHAYTLPHWKRSGTDDQPSFTPSLLVTHGKEHPGRCHLYLTDGKLKFLGDCTHALKGQTVPIPEPPKWLHDDGEVTP